jgi:diguanylate cyclase (GGDEF)-like protein/PAS domain S-box-containing protein
MRDNGESKQAEEILYGEKRTLEMIASGEPLEHVLSVLAQTIEKQSPGMFCSVLLLDPDGVHLRHGAAPSLPESYTRAIDGIAIGPRVGSCGTATYRRKRVIVPDIASDPLWEDYRHLPLQHGLRACWSEPILTSKGEILGTFAMYYGQSRSPNPEDLRLLERAVNIAAIAIERKRSQEAFNENQRMLATLLSNLPGYAYRCKNDKDWTVEFISEGVFELTGYKASEYLVDRTITCGEKTHPDDRERVWSEVQAALEKRQPFELVYRIITKSNEEKWVWERGQGIFSPEGDLHHIEGFVTDITEQKRQTEALEYQATHDILTQLPNRYLLYDRLQQAILAARHNGKPLALLLMDLDRFKELNDTLGHHHGDLLLQQMGRRLKNTLWEPDTVARLGGDEFAVLLPVIASPDDVAVVANKILKALEEPFIVEGLSLELGASIGIALFPDHGEDAETLIRRADVAMYVAKQSGTGYAIYTLEHDQHSPGRLALMGELRHAIEQEELILHYQPKLSLKDRRVIGVEALVRWQHPIRGLILPEQFIPLAERSGLINLLTTWVVTEAIRQCRAWQREKLPFPVTVNLSARNLQDPQFPNQLQKLLKEYEVRPSCLELEITESTFMADPTPALEDLLRLTQMGLRISIDDFGTGYSSLGYLKKLPVDTIKVDKSFVMNMAMDNDDAVIVRTTIDLAHNLGLNVVAEGVENQETLNQLLSLDCDAAQGHFICRPLPIGELHHWLNGSAFKVEYPKRPSRKD